MELRKAIRKIAALGIGATMAGATILGAVTAADLSEYPAPFIKDGKISGVLVIGDKAAAEDVIGVSDIAVSLQFAATKKAGTTTYATTTVTGDAWRVDKANKLQMSENLDAATGTNQESIVNITTSIDEDELAALADGEVVNDKGTAGYNQYLKFNNQRSSGYVIYVEDDEDVTADFLYFKSGDQVAAYEIEFKTNFESDIEDSAGSNTVTGLYLGDFEDETITILGKEFEIVKARRTSTSGGNGANAELTLMGGSHKDTLQEGESKTYTVNSKEYEVTVSSITDSAPIVAKFVVNGEVTKSLSDGQSDKLADGIDIGVTEILPNEAGDVTQDLVQFYLGAQKIFLKDTDMSDKASTNSLEFGNEKIDDAFTVIEGSNTTTMAISKIFINVMADDDFYVPAGGKLTDQMDEPQALLDQWDIEYKGLETVATNPIKVKTSGSDQYELEFTDGGGQQATVPLAYTSGGTALRMGDDDDILVINESQVITKDDYFIVSDYSLDAGRRTTYALRYKGSDKSSADNPNIKFDLMGTGERLDRTYSAQTGAADATLKLGGKTFNIFNNSADSSSDFDIVVDLNGDGDNVDGQDSTTASGDLLSITTNDGAQIQINNVTYTPRGINVTISTPNGDDYDNLAPTQISLNVTASGGEVRASEISFFNLKTPEDDKYHAHGYTSMGAFIDLYSPTNDPNSLTVDYPVEQRRPQVFITAGVTETVVSEGGTQESVTLQRIDVGATKLASEITGKETTQNVIAVGGPCANAATAVLMGSPEDCLAGFEAGKGMIKLVENGGNVAMIVAGYSATDSRAATSIVANAKAGDLSGNNMEVTTATSTVVEVTTT